MATLLNASSQQDALSGQSRKRRKVIAWCPTCNCRREVVLESEEIDDRDTHDGGIDSVAEKRGSIPFRPTCDSDLYNMIAAGMGKKQSVSVQPSNSNVDEDSSLRDDVRDVIKTMYPKIKSVTKLFNSKQIDTLNHFMDRFSEKKRSKQGLMRDTKHIVISILEAYPTFKGEIIRKELDKFLKPKTNYVTQCVSTLIVLASYFDISVLSAFLEKCGTFYIFPPCGKRRNLRLTFVDDELEGLEDAVTKLDITIRLIYFSLSSSVAMNSKDNEANLQSDYFSQDIVQSNFNEGVGRQDGTTTEKQPGDKGGKTSTLLERHVPRSFSAHIWLQLKSMKLAFYVFEMLFGKRISSRGVYMNLKKNERVVEYLLRATIHCDTYTMLMEFLVDLCLFFDSYAGIAEHNALLSNVVKSGSEYLLSSEIASRSQFSRKDKISRIRSTFDNAGQRGRQKTKISNKSRIHRQTHLDKERLYQHLRAFVFKFYLDISTKEIGRLKEEVENLHDIDSGDFDIII